MLCNSPSKLMPLSSKSVATEASCGAASSGLARIRVECGRVTVVTCSVVACDKVLKGGVTVVICLVAAAGNSAGVASPSAIGVAGVSTCVAGTIVLVRQEEPCAASGLSWLQLVSQSG